MIYVTKYHKNTTGYRNELINRKYDQGDVCVIYKYQVVWSRGWGGGTYKHSHCFKKTNLNT